jgi:Holliday junction DNA helicase RuvA
LFYSVKGTIEFIGENLIALENGGITYEIAVSANTVAKLSGKKEATLYTYLQVKEDGLTLYGFNSREEKKMFENLLTVSGVGCKVALAVLSGMSLENLAVCIAEENVSMLSNIKGIGKKTAERIILELREKVPKESGGKMADTDVAFAGGAANDAYAALMALGFKKAECEAAIKKAVQSGADTVEKIIGNVLKNM